MLRRAFVIAALFISPPVELIAQFFPVQKFSVEDGVGHPIVYRTMQTSDGYLWFSTDNGITRYDGATFRNFTTEHGLPSNFIFEVVEWDSTIYVATLGGGIVKYTHERFEPAFDSSAHMPLHPIEIRISTDLFFVVDRFKDLYILQDSEFHLVTPARLGLPNHVILDVFDVEIYDEVAYIATNLGLYTFSNGVFSAVDVRVSEPVFIHRLLKISDNRILIVINDRLVEYDLVTHNYEIIFDHDVLARFTRLKLDSEGNLWLSTVSGNVFILRRNEDGYQTIHVFSEIVMNDIFEDREKNIWLGTYGEGVWLVQSTMIQNHPINGNIVSDLGIDPETGDLIVTTINAGLKIFRPNRNGFLEQIEKTRFEPLIANDIFLGPVANAPGKSILLGVSHNLARLSGGSAAVLELNRPVTSIHFQEKKNRIWIGCRFGLAYCDLTMTNATWVDGLDSFVIRTIAELPDGRIVIGTDDGVFIQNGDLFEPFPAEPSLAKADINALSLDESDSTLWVGTNSGLAFTRNGRLELVNNPITKVRCNSIAHDQYGNMFVGSVAGLIHYDGKNFAVLTTREGLAQSSVIRLHYNKDREILTVLSSNSISTIDRKYFPEILEFEVPDILVENMSTQDQEFKFNGQLMELPSPSKQLTIRVATPQIRNRNRVAYRYRINDKPWTSFNGREIVLYSLPSGNLTISLQSYKINDESDNRTINLAFYIPPPFYLTWWFISIIAIVLVGSFSLLLGYYARERNKKLVEENKRLDLEHKALRNLLNPHFLYNAINSIHAFILQNDQKQTLGYLSKFSQLVRLNLELLSTDHASLDKEIKNISLYLEFEKLRFAEKLNYNIEIDPRLVQSEVTVPSFIIQPFVENAIWHGLLPRKEGGMLQLRVKLDSSAIVVVIDDNGIGINESLRHPKAEIDKKPSMGINVLLERFDLLRKVNPHYHITIEDKADTPELTKESGTRVTITIPL